MVYLKKGKFKIPTANPYVSRSHMEANLLLMVTSSAALWIGLLVGSLCKQVDFFLSVKNVTP